MKKSYSEAILQTIRYADLFDFPLKEEELRQFLIGSSFKAEIPLGAYCRVGKYFVLPRRQKIIASRKKRDLITLQKVNRAQKLALWLRFFPGIRMVGLSGSVAAGNARELDDIDLVVVTARGRIWLTRALVLFLTGTLGLRRWDKQEDHYDNKFCFNLWLEDSRRGLRMKNKDLYTAYEVCLFKPLFGGETYRKFLKANGWTGKFLPNFEEEYGKKHLREGIPSLLSWPFRLFQELLILNFLGWALEPAAKALFKRRIIQKQKIKPSRGVVLSRHQLLFHNDSARARVLASLGKRS